MTALESCIQRAAHEVGRFRLRVNADQDLGRFVFLADRLADELELALLMLTPSAAEIAASVYPGDDKTIAAAIEHVDAHTQTIRRLLRADIAEKHLAELAA